MINATSEEQQSLFISLVFTNKLLVICSVANLNIWVIFSELKLHYSLIFSGLAAAYKLSLRGLNVTIFEAEERAGGKLRSVSQDGLIWDEGANTMVEIPPSIFPYCKNFSDTNLCIAAKSSITLIKL